MKFTWKGTRRGEWSETIGDSVDNIPHVTVVITNEAGKDWFVSVNARTLGAFHGRFSAEKEAQAVALDVAEALQNVYDKHAKTRAS